MTGRERLIQGLRRLMSKLIPIRESIDKGVSEDGESLSSFQNDSVFAHII